MPIFHRNFTEWWQIHGSDRRPTWSIRYRRRSYRYGITGDGHLTSRVSGLARSDSQQNQSGHTAHSRGDVVDGETFIAELTVV
jgi:hypothetical protein